MTTPAITGRVCSRPSLTLLAQQKTVFHPLQATTIKEASVDGNLLVHDDVYLVQLGWPPAELSDFAIPSFNNQLTNAQIHGRQYLCKKDVSSWECWEVLQLSFGTLHLVMNLLWSMLKTHCGTVGCIRSLALFFAVLQKAQLGGGEYPDYHTLLSAMKQILHRLILNTWHVESNYSTLCDFAKGQGQPKPWCLTSMCTHIFQ